jgi:hypothetical protein
LADYKNPCWHPANATAGTPARHCLPFYFILGDFQCGVRDLASRVLKVRQHPRGQRAQAPADAAVRAPAPRCAAVGQLRAALVGAFP